MSKTENIYQKLNNFRLEVGAIRKDKSNPYHKSKYADINTVLEAVTDKLSTVGLIDVDTTKKGENGKMWLNTKLVNIDNPEEFLEIETPLLIKDPNNPQALGSALTYCRRYNRVTLLGLEQEDDDGNTAAGLNKKTKYPEPKKVQQNPNMAQNLKNQKRELSQYLKIKGIPLKTQPDFINFLKGKDYDVNNSKQLSYLLQNKNILDEFIDKYLEMKLAEAGI